MLELLIIFGLPLLQKIGIGDIIGLSGLAKGLIRKISEEDAFGILKKALDETIKKSEDDKAKEILKNLKKNDEVLRELRKLDVSEESKKSLESLVSQYFNGREDVFEDLAKNYYELFCKEATKKDRTFKEFVVIELGKLANQGIITNEVVENVKRYLEGIIEELKKKKEAESRQFLITSDLKELGGEILRGKPQIEYVEREEIKEAQEALKTKNKLLVVGKPGAGKSRFLLRILEDFKGYERFVLIRSFFRKDGIRSLDEELQERDSFILIWDDLHIARKEIVNQTINQVEQLAKDYGKKYMFIGASRMEGEYYQFKPEETKLEDFKSLELIEKCSAYFGVSVDGVKERLLEVGDGTPFYVISLFATSKERGKERLTRDDLKTLPNDSFEIWHDHLNFLESEGRLSTSEKNVLRSIALAMRAVPTIDFDMLEKFYEKIFRGDLSEFDYALKSIGKKFFIGIEGEFCSMHAVQAAVVEGKYPIEERKIERLKEVITSLERDKCLMLLWDFARWFHANKKYGDCLKFIDVFIVQEPNIAEAYNNRGTVYDKLNEHERAIANFNKAIELNSNFAEAYNNRGLAYIVLGQYGMAIADCNKAIELNPNFAVTYNNRGLAYIGLGQHERAIADCNKAIELNPNFVWAYNNRGSAYLGLKQYELAIADYNKAIELSPKYAEAYNNRGNAYDGLNQHERAISDYNKAIELNPNFAGAYGNRGKAHSEIGRYEESARDYKKAGILFFGSGGVDDSVKSFSFCFDLRPKIENVDVIYSGLILFFITLNPDVIIELRRMKIQDENLKKIFKLSLSKLRNKDISEEIRVLEEKERREEMKILLELLKRF